MQGLLDELALHAFLWPMSHFSLFWLVNIRQLNRAPPAVDNLLESTRAQLFRLIPLMQRLDVHLIDHLHLPSCLLLLHVAKFVQLLAEPAALEQMGVLAKA